MDTKPNNENGSGSITGGTIAVVLTGLGFFSILLFEGGAYSGTDCISGIGMIYTLFGAPVALIMSLIALGADKQKWLAVIALILNIIWIVWEVHFRSTFSMVG